MNKFFPKLSSVLLLLGVLLSAHAQAADYPEKGKTIMLTVPFPPGGASDVIGRLIAQKLSESWGVDAVVDNRAGGESMVGASVVANSRKDGYHMGLFTLDFVLNRIVHAKNQSYDAARDFTPVSLLAKSPLYLVVNGKSDIDSFADLKKLSTEKPDGVFYSSCCSVMNFSTEMLKNASGIKGEHVPYKGSSPSVNAVVAGETTYAIDTPVSVQSYMQAGRLKGLAVTSRKRDPSFPDVPSLTDVGVPGDFELATWWGILMPAGVSEDIVTKLNAQLHKILEQDDVKKKLAEFGVQIAPTSPADFAKLMESDYQRYLKVAKDNNLLFAD